MGNLRESKQRPILLSLNLNKLYKIDAGKQWERSKPKEKKNRKMKFCISFGGGREFFSSREDLQ